MLVILCTVTARDVRAQDNKPEERAVLAVVQRLFDGMRTRDTLALQEVFDPGARLLGMRTRSRDGQEVVQNLSAADFINFIAKDPRTPWIERAFDPDVHVSGTLAAVWAEYDFHFGQKLSHCGVDAVHLLKTPVGWKIVQITDTFVQQGCKDRGVPPQ
jgi:hypothetical protein